MFWSPYCQQGMGYLKKNLQVTLKKDKQHITATTNQTTFFISNNFTESLQLQWNLKFEIGLS